MNCPKCKSENEMGALYCKRCGSKLLQSSTVKFDHASLMLIIYILIAIGCTLFRAIVPILGDFLDMRWESTLTLTIGGYMLQDISFILIPLAIKNMLLKIIGVVISIPLILYWLYDSFQNIIHIY